MCGLYGVRVECKEVRGWSTPIRYVAGSRQADCQSCPIAIQMGLLTSATSAQILVRSTSPVPLHRLQAHSPALTRPIPRPRR